MAEYIEREAAVAVFEERQKALCPVGKWSRNQANDREKFDAWEEILDELRAIPDAGVAPVVRCKDCGNFRQNVHGICWCDEYGGAITPEDYCSRAVTDKPSRVKIPREAD